MSTIRKTSRVFIIIAVLAGLIALAYFKILPMLKNDEPSEPEQPAEEDDSFIKLLKNFVDASIKFFKALNH